MPFQRLPRALEQLLDNLLDENVVSSFRVDSNPRKTTLILRFSSISEDVMAADPVTSRPTTTTATFRRKSQAQVDRDRRRAEAHRSTQDLQNDVIELCDVQASDIASSTRVDPPPPPPPNSDVLTHHRPTMDVNKAASRSEDAASAREKRSTTTSTPRVVNTVAKVKVQEPTIQQQPAMHTTAATTRDNIGLRPAQNEYRNRLRSANRNVGMVGVSPSASFMHDPVTQSLDDRMSELIQVHSESTRQFQQSLQSCCQRLEDGISACALPPNLPSSRKAQFRPDMQ